MELLVVSGGDHGRGNRFHPFNLSDWRRSSSQFAPWLLTSGEPLGYRAE